MASEMQPKKAKACSHLNISSHTNVDFLWRLFHPADPLSASLGFLTPPMKTTTLPDSQVLHDLSCH